jgi:hypothetical protein
VFNIKLVELEILNISCFENFSSCYMILEVIWKKQFEFEMGGELPCTVNRGRPPRSMGTGEPPWPSTGF